MLIEAAGQSEQLTWDTSSGHDAQNGDFEQETWSFTATGSRTGLKFESLDPKPRRAVCGPVIGAISVTQN